MKLEKAIIEINKFPKELHSYLQNNNIFDSSCHSTSKVYYIDSGYYLKIDEKESLRKQMELTKKFHDIGFGVEVVLYLSTDKDYMITKSAIGQDCTHYLANPKKLCEILASTLQKLHKQDINNHSLSSRIERYHDLLKNKFDSCSFDQDVILSFLSINSKEEAVSIIENNIGKLKTDTLIHGDYCLPNIILNNGTFSSLIDFDMSGIGDKHIDLYWALWSLEFNLGTDSYNNYFLDLYGRDNFDFEMLEVIAALEALC